MTRPEIDVLKDTLTVPQVAEICRVNRVTVTRWIQAGRLRAIRPPTGTPLYIRKEDFAEFWGGYVFTDAEKGVANDPQKDD